MIMTKPSNPYSPDWPAYWAANPGMRKSVGAAADPGDPPSDPPNDPPADPPNDPPAIDPAQFQKLQESVEKLEAKNKELLDEKKRAKKEAEEAALEAAKKGGDVEALEKSWNDKLQNLENEYQGKLKEYEGLVSQMTAGTEASRIANELALPGYSEVLMPHITPRLQTEIKDGKPIVRVLDKDGKPSAMSVEDLKKEISEMKSFAPVLVGSNANGGGTPKPGESSAKTVKRSQFNQMNHGERQKFFKDGGKVVDD